MSPQAIFFSLLKNSNDKKEAETLGKVIFIFIF